MDLDKLVVRAAAHVNTYQRGQRVAKGRDHWEWYVGESGAGRHRFYERLLGQASVPFQAAFAASGAQPFAEAKGPPVDAIIQNNRWLFLCPACGGGEVVDPEDPVAFCWSCLGAANDGRPYNVRFPDGDTRSDIEEVLSLRPAVVNRGWLPHEKVKDLEDENESHGLPRRPLKPPKPEQGSDL